MNVPGEAMMSTFLGKISVWAGIFAMVAAATLAVAWVTHDEPVSAEDVRSIPFTVIQPDPAYFKNGIVKDGPCAITTLDNPVYRGTSQIIIRDENGKTLNVTDLLNGKAIDLNGNGDLKCIAGGRIEVPDAGFYTMYLDDHRITTIQPTQFPIGDSKRIMIELPNPRTVLDQ